MRWSEPPHTPIIAYIATRTPAGMTLRPYDTSSYRYLGVFIYRIKNLWDFNPQESFFSRYKRRALVRAFPHTYHCLYRDQDASQHDITALRHLFVSVFKSFYVPDKKPMRFQPPGVFFLSISALSFGQSLATHLSLLISRPGRQPARHYDRTTPLRIGI